MGDLLKTFSGLWGPSGSKMTLDDMILKLTELRRKGAPGNSVVTLVCDVNGVVVEFGSLGQTTLSINDGDTKISISLKS